MVSYRTISSMVIALAMYLHRYICRLKVCGSPSSSTGFVAVVNPECDGRILSVRRFACFAVLSRLFKM